MAAEKLEPVKKTAQSGTYKKGDEEENQAANRCIHTRGCRRNAGIAKAASIPDKFWSYLTSSELKATTWIPRGPPSLDTSTGLSMPLQEP